MPRTEQDIDPDTEDKTRDEPLSRTEADPDEASVVRGRHPEELEDDEIVELDFDDDDLDLDLDDLDRMEGRDA